MGAIINIDEEREAIKLLHHAPAQVKEILSHHLRNGLQEIMNGIMEKDFDIVKSGTKHIMQDLDRFGL